MSTIIRSRIVKIGNSQGVRIPKLLLDQTNLGGEVELEVHEGQIQKTRPCVIISPDEMNRHIATLIVDKSRLAHKLGRLSKPTQTAVLDTLAEMLSE